MLRFFFYNLAGSIVPLLAALVAVPIIAQHAGIERLGLLGVLWAVVGYFGILDFGLSRVITKRIAQASAQDRLGDEMQMLRSFFWWRAVPALCLIALLIYLSPYLGKADWWSGPLAQEVLRGWEWIALTIAVTLATNWLRGALEGLHCFLPLNVLRSLFGTWNYVAPAVAVLFDPSLEAMVAGIATGRVVAFAAHVFLCSHIAPALLFGSTSSRVENLKGLLREGGWMTVSNVISPLMVYADRLVMAGFLPAHAVAWYATSQEVVLRMLIIPGALAGVLFPRFSATVSAAGPDATALYRKGVRALAAIMLPLCVLVSVCAYDGMAIWMGELFAAQSYRIVQIIAIGLFVNALAQVPFSWLQAAGKSKLTARLHFAELPFYAALLIAGIHYLGVEGAAWAWVIRVTFDYIALVFLKGNQTLTDALVSVIGAFAIGLAGNFASSGLPFDERLVLIAVSGGFTCLIAWYVILRSEDRSTLLKLCHAD